jgi:hypothetical protein
VRCRKLRARRRHAPSHVWRASIRAAFQKDGLSVRRLHAALSPRTSDCLIRQLNAWALSSRPTCATRTPSALIMAGASGRPLLQKLRRAFQDCRGICCGRDAPRERQRFDVARPRAPSVLVTTYALASGGSYFWPTQREGRTSSGEEAGRFAAAYEQFHNMPLLRQPRLRHNMGERQNDEHSNCWQSLPHERRGRRRVRHGSSGLMVEA